MSKVQIIMSRDIYLDTPVTPITLANPLYVGDNDAQRVRFRVFQQHGDTVPMDLTGVTVMMHFIRPDGGDVVITGTPGTEWSYVDMPQACYAYKGLFAFSVHLISDDQTATTVMKACGQLDKVTTDTIIDPGHVIPSLEELLAKLDDMDDAVTACNAAAAAADAAADNANAAVSYLAPVYSAESTYNAGEYVIQDGKLYRCTADISTAEAWTAAHWTEVVFGDEISNLKSAFDTYISEDTVIGKATLVKTLSNANISSSTWAITAVDNSKVAILDVANAPICVCNFTGNRFLTMFVDSADADIGTVGTTVNNPGNNPTIVNYVIGNPRRARYLAVWYATSEKPFTGDIELHNNNLATVQENALIANQKTDQVEFKKPTGVRRPVAYADALVEVFGNSVKVDGTITAINLRCSIYGENLDTSSSAPTYDKFPQAYHEPVSSFVVGHEYAVSVRQIAGEVTTTTEDVYPYLDLRTQAGDVQMFDGTPLLVTKWTCTFVPEAIFFVLRGGVYSSAIFQYSIVDLTVFGQNDITAQYLYEKIKNRDYSIPSYFDTQLSTAVTKINTDINSGKTEGTYGTDIESFVFITDVHWSANKKHSPALIKKILESCPIKTVICGGDLIESMSPTKAGAVSEVKGFIDSITMIPCYEFLTVFGNHDNNGINSNPISEQFTKEEQYNILYAPFSEKANVHWIWEDVPSIFNDTVVKNDYYVNHPRTRTRFLCIDWNNPMSTNRSEWIASVLGKNDGYRVIVVYHGIYSGSTGTLTPEHTAIMSALEPYKSKIVALFTGHAHMDDVVDYYGDGSVPVILTSCDKFSENAGAVENTVDEQCFDVAVIDYKLGKIKLTRIGRGSDRTVDFSVS